MTRQVTDNLYIDLEYFTPENYYVYEANAESDSSVTFTCSANAGIIKSATASISTSATVSATGRLVTRFIGDPTVNSGTTFSTLEIDTATKQFGAGSLRFNEKLAADNTLKAHISFPDHPGFDTWKTIDFWIYMGTRPAGGSGVIPILRKGALNEANAETAWLVSAVGTSNVNKYYIIVTGWDTSGNAVSLGGTNSEGLFDANAWSHVRIVNNASASSLYINGVKLTNAAATGRNLPDTFRSNTAPLLIGGGDLNQHGTSTVFAQYRLDEILITDELLNDPSASTITVPSAPFVNSTDTDGLWHFDTDFRDDNLANVTFASALSATATQTAEAVRTRSTAVALTSTASISASAQSTQSAQSSLNTISTVSAQAQANFVSSADLAVSGFVLAAAGRLQSDVADLDVVSALTATVTRNRGHSAALTSAFTVTAEGLDLDLATAALTLAFTQTATATTIRRSSVTLNSAVTTTASADKIVSDWRSYHWGWGLRQGDVPGSGGVYQHITSRSSAFDDNENIYELLSRWTEQSSPLNTLLLVKRNSQGDVIWKKQFDLGTVDTQTHPEHAKISYFNEHLYISTSYFTTFPAWESLIWKLNLDGDRQWGRVAFKIVDHYVDSTGVYFLEGLNSSAIYKLNDSTGASAWKGNYEQTVSNVPMSITGDVDYIYFSTEDPHIFALNKSTGAQVWRRRLDLPSLETDRNNYLDVNADDELVIAHDRGNGSSYIVNIDSSTGAANSSKNIDIGIRELLIDEYTGQHYLLTGASTIQALNSDLTADWNRTFSVSTTLLEEMKHVAFNEYQLLIGGLGIKLDLGGGASYLLKNNKNGGAIYSGINLKTPYSGTFEFTSDTAPTITTASVSSITSTTGTYTTETGSLSSDSTNWATDSNTIDYEWINVVDGLSNINSQFTVAAVPIYSRNATAALSSQATLSAQPIVILKATAAFATVATVGVTATRIRSISSAVSASAAVSAVGTRTRITDSALSANSAFSASADRFRPADASLTVTASQTTVNTRVRDFDSDFDVIASQLSAAARVGDGFVAIDVNASLSATAIKFTDTPINLTVASTLTADSNNILTASSDISAVATITVNTDKLKAIEAILSASATITAVAVKNTVTASNLSANIAVSAVNTRARLFDTALVTAASLTAQAQRNRLAASDLFVTTEQFASPFFLFRATANLQVTGFQLTAGRVIHLDPYYTYLIPEESRAYIITEESRFYQIEQETRTLKI
jgi:hypothetical protein